MSREGWRKVADAIIRRRAEQGWTQLDLAKRGPLSLDRVQSLEGAKRDSYRANTIAAMERALEWQNGSIAAIMRGEEPREIRGMRAEYHFTDEQVREMASRLPAETIREIYQESEAVPDDSADAPAAEPPKYDDPGLEEIWRNKHLSELERRMAIISIQAWRQTRESGEETRRSGTA